MYKILILDDNKLSADTIKDLNIWRDLNCKVVGVCYDTETGKEAISKYSPDILILDIRMPGENGLDLLQNFSEELKNTRVIFMSAYASFYYAQRALKLGALDYLLKPFTVDELTSAVRAAILALDDRASEAKISTIHLPDGELEVDAAVQPIISYMEDHLGDHLSAEETAEMFCMSISKLDKLMNQYFGKGFREMRISMRIQKAKELLLDIRYSVEEVATKVGYKNYKSFHRAFTRECGISPTEYRNPLASQTASEMVYAHENQ